MENDLCVKKELNVKKKLVKQVQSALPSSEAIAFLKIPSKGNAAMII